MQSSVTLSILGTLREVEGVPQCHTALGPHSLAPWGGGAVLPSSMGSGGSCQVLLGPPRSEGSGSFQPRVSSFFLATEGGFKISAPNYNL